jgi:hypothetical protein
MQLVDLFIHEWLAINLKKNLLVRCYFWVQFELKFRISPEQTLRAVIASNF